MAGLEVTLLGPSPQLTDIPDMSLQFRLGIRRSLCGALLAVIMGCVNTVAVKDILNDPRAYADRTVTIEGEVVGIMSLVVVKYFTVNDGTGSINVVTDKPLPQKGRRIRVTGKVNELFSLGTETLLVLIEDSGEAKPRMERTGEAARRK